ncbi:caspase domain-containing protein [Xylaria arbuscula]|nr:caspase domain-containing protein [Xylaria arbuscula]
MEDLSCTPTHFALFIGVNADDERPLKGCVRDVREISKHVNNSLFRVHTQIFTAQDPSTRFEITDQLESLATYSNIKAGLDTILSIAQPGSYVYIHYSGHGVRIKASSEFSNWATGDLALNVLEDSSSVDTRPFPGLELAKILRHMVSQGLLVTLVLDCCFSGSVVRGHRSRYSQVRYRQFRRTSPDIAPSLLEVDTENEDEDEVDEKRDISMLPNWLVDPQGYTIITACGPREVALELNIGGESSDHRHGALSYFLLRAMRKLGGLGGKHAHIYPYLCSLFRQFRPTQNPMWYGNNELYFFGDATLSSEVTGSPFAVAWNGHLLQLQGGQAHGIREGDQFAVYTMSSSRTGVTGRVKKVRPLTSDLEIKDATTIRRERGCIARALTHFELKRYPIELCLSSPYSQEWSDALRERQHLSFQDDKGPFAFRIFPDDGSVLYRIRNNQSGQETRCLFPSMGRDSLVMTEGRVLDIAERLVRYQLVRDLTSNASNSFQGKYRASILDHSGNRFQPGTLINVMHGSRLVLAIQNTGAIDLYLHVYNLGPLGKVQNIQTASYTVLPPRNIDQGFTGEVNLRFRALLSSKIIQRGLSSCEDTIKVFLTSMPTSFASLEIQDLDDFEDRGPVEPVVGHHVSIEEEDWTSLSFTICIIQQ